MTLGSDGAGEIAALGAAFSDLAVGDAVVIDPMLDWGDDPHVWDAEHSRLLGMPSDGTWAQYVVVPAQNVYPKPAKSLDGGSRAQFRSPVSPPTARSLRAARCSAAKRS